MNMTATTPFYTTKSKLLFLLILNIVLNLSVMAQVKREYINKQFWLDYNPSYIINNKLSVYSDFGIRTISTTDWYRYNIRIGVNYKPFILSDNIALIKNLQIHAGVGDFFTLTTNDININEFRIYQGVRAYWPSLKHIRIAHYLRVEERFENLFQRKTEVFTARMRYQLSGKIYLTKNFLQNLYFPVSIEFFMGLGQGLYFNDVMRLTPGIGYNFTDQFRTEFQLSYHNSRNSPNESFQNNDLVFRLRVFQIF